AGGTLSWPVNVIGRRPSAARPWRLGQTPAGWTVELVDYAPLLAADFEPAPVPSGGQPAVRVRLFSKRLNRTMESWLLVGSEEHAAFDLGMASVQLRAGRAPATPEAAAKGAAAAATDIDESIFAFAHKPGQQVAQPAAGKAGSGAKVRLVVTDSARQVHLDWRGATWDFDVEADRGKDQDLSGSGLTARIEDYWPDFLMKDGQPTSASNEPREPAVLVRIFGQLAPDPEADSLAAMNAPSENGASSANQATIYCDAASGALTYVLKSGATPQPVVGALTAGGPGINTGWADWQLSVDQSLPSATDYTAFHPVEGAKKGPEAGAMAQGNHTEGLRVRLSKPGSPTVEEWVPAGWQVALPTGGSSAPTQLSYGWRCESLPIGLQLLDFEIERGEGSDAPAGFKSTLRVVDNEGRVDSGQCWMNNPHNYPGHWWNTFTGLTFKMSQASYNPENPNESTIQILRDPGWLLKWIGSLLVCAGIFTLFYLRPHPVFVEGKAPSARGQKSSKSQARSSKQAQINPSSKKT
ncbi:MAG: hypothetical protein JO117_09625, partial [Verrucomicrobia bacterium]|nr:hypothetical protein [Verrucomicrobiota bacterium]